MEIWIVVGTIGGFLAGGWMVWLVYKGRLDPMKNDIDMKNTENQILTEKQIELEKEVTRLNTELISERNAVEEKKADLEESRKVLAIEFENLANRIFDEKRTKFIDENKLSLGNLIDPLKQQIEKFEGTVKDTYEKEGRERFSLVREIKGLQELNKRLSNDAESLTRALKGDPQQRGAWGELILERVLEESGLRKGKEYFTQGGFRGEDNNLLKPDVIVQLPDEKDVIIDSKVSLISYEEYVNAETDEERDVAAKAYLSSINGHLKGLSEKSYEEIPELRSLDFVLMFIPIESAFVLAIEKEKDIFSKAFQKKVIIVSPTTLLVTLRTIQNMWRYEYQTKNAQEIARQAGGLYDKFAGFVSDIEDIGKHINKTQGACEAAYNKLSTGKGNLMGRAQKLKELGVKSKKSIRAGDAQEIDEDLPDVGLEEEIAVSD